MDPSTCVHFGRLCVCVPVCGRVCVVHFGAANHVGLITSAQGCFIHASRSIQAKLQLLLCRRPLSTKSWAAKWRVAGCRVLLPACCPLHYIRGWCPLPQSPISLPGYPHHPHRILAVGFNCNGPNQKIIWCV